MLIVGIAGGSGAGKTSLCKNLFDILTKKGVGVQVICHDSYYKDISHKSMEERDKTNFDHPDALDTDLLIEHIRQLKTGKPVNIPTYDFTTHSRTKKTIEVFPSEVIIIEGILILASEELLSEMDLSFFVESRPDTRLGRRIQRDVKARGRSMESVLTQFRETVQPMYEQWVGPTKHLADFILSGEKWPTQNSMEFMLRGLSLPHKKDKILSSPGKFSPTNYLPLRMETVTVDRKSSCDESDSSNPPAAAIPGGHYRALAPSGSKDRLTASPLLLAATAALLEHEKSAFYSLPPPNLASE